MAPPRRTSSRKKQPPRYLQPPAAEQQSEASPRRRTSAAATVSSSSTSSAPLSKKRRRSVGTRTSTGSLGTSTSSSSSSRRKVEPEVRVYVDSVREKDVILGKGPGVNRHPGNVDFRRMVKTYLKRYVSANKTGKTEVCKEIVGVLKGKGVFVLQKADTSDQWFHVTDHTTRTKASLIIQDILKKRRRGDVSDSASDDNQEEEEEEEEGIGAETSEIYGSDEEKSHKETPLGTESTEDAKRPALLLPEASHANVDIPTSPGSLHEHVQSVTFPPAAAAAAAAAAGDDEKSPSTSSDANNSPGSQHQVPADGEESRPIAQLRPASIPYHLRYPQFFGQSHEDSDHEGEV